MLWPPDAKSRLIGKDPDAGKIEGKSRKGWQKMRWLDITDSMGVNVSKPGDSGGRRSPACYSAWDHKEADPA